jgi:hypothetical protein
MDVWSTRKKEGIQQDEFCRQGAANIPCRMTKVKIEFSSPYHEVFLDQQEEHV